MLVLHAIETWSHFNFGKHVFYNVLAFVDGGLRSTRLPFPSLIYGVLESQGFISHINEALTGVVDRLNIARTLLKGNRNIDLPWVITGVVPGVGHTATTTLMFKHPHRPSKAFPTSLCTLPFFNPNRFRHTAYSSSQGRNCPLWESSGWVPSSFRRG